MKAWFTAFLLVTHFLKFLTKAHQASGEHLDNQLLGVEQHVYDEVNKLREDPWAYIHEMGWSLSCHVPQGASYQPLTVVHELEESSQFQAFTLAHRECALSHETCLDYCYLFGGDCSHIQRIQHFLGGRYTQGILSEVLISGPKKPHRLIELFLKSEGHCKHLLEPSLNSMGANFTHVHRNVFVLDLAELN